MAENFELNNDGAFAFFLSKKSKPNSWQKKIKRDLTKLVFSPSVKRSGRYVQIIFNFGLTPEN